MSDGAHQGIIPTRALGTILGGQPAPADDEGMDAESFTAWIMAAPDPAMYPGEIASDEEGYDLCARATAKVILTHLLAHPDDMRLPLEHEYQWTEDGRDVVRDAEGRAITLNVSLWDVLYERYPLARERIFSGLTGFQAGWAVNAARRCLEAPPVPNPAIVEIGT